MQTVLHYLSNITNENKRLGFLIVHINWINCKAMLSGKNLKWQAQVEDMVQEMDVGSLIACSKLFGRLRSADNLLRFPAYSRTCHTSAGI